VRIRGRRRRHSPARGGRRVTCYATEPRRRAVGRSARHSATWARARPPRAAIPSRPTWQRAASLSPPTVRPCATGRRASPRRRAPGGSPRLRRSCRSSSAPRAPSQPPRPGSASRSARRRQRRRRARSRGRRSAARVRRTPGGAVRGPDLLSTSGSQSHLRCDPPPELEAFASVTLDPSQKPMTLRRWRRLQEERRSRER